MRHKAHAVAKFYPWRPLSSALPECRAVPPDSGRDPNQPPEIASMQSNKLLASQQSDQKFASAQSLHQLSRDNENHHQLARDNKCTHGNSKVKTMMM
jgi:hypothetical protein